MIVTTNIIKNEVSPYLVEAFSQIGKRVVLAEKEPIFKQDKVPVGCYYLLKGHVLARQQTPFSTESLFIFCEGTLSLSTDTLIGTPTTFCIQALDNVEAIYLLREELWDLIERDKDVARFVITNIIHILYSFKLKLFEKTHHDVTWRIYNLFVDLVDIFGVKSEKGIKIDYKISQQFISDILSINRITTVKKIRNLKENGIIDYLDGYYYVLDMKKLKYFLEMLS